ncbi:MAG TPA: hypothetical protein DCP71_04035 [Verrucomicrobiales bacterium]|jgi:hypothetical protein|nr:hypothetical protein [Verrucomicrobiales bacterium]
MGCFNCLARWEVSRTNLHLINKPKSTIMKLKSMTSVITKSALVLAASASLSAFAGTSAPAKGTQTIVPEESGALFDTVGATLEVGYDTRYYFRGLWFADNTVWTGLSLSIPLTEQLSLGFGALYTTTVETSSSNAGIGGVDGAGDFDYSELDLSTSLTYDAGFAKFGLVYTHYEFFDGFSGTNFGIPNGGGELNVSGVEEVGMTVAAPLGPVNFYAGFFYDLTIGASYAEVGADLPIEITSWLSLVPAIKTGYGFSNYYTIVGQSHQSGLTHVIPSLSAPIKLTKSATLTPYIAYNISLDTRHLNNTEDNEIFGGVKLSVSF